MGELATKAKTMTTMTTSSFKNEFAKDHVHGLAGCSRIRLYVRTSMIIACHFIQEETLVWYTVMRSYTKFCVVMKLSATGLNCQ